MEFDPILDGEFFHKSVRITHMNLKTGETREEKIKQEPTYIPMVCFCDIPLSSVEFHMDVYSSYGIGLDKSWGEEKGLNPVMYVNEDSTFFKMVSGLTTQLDYNYRSHVEWVQKELQTLSADGKDVQSIQQALIMDRYHTLLLRDAIVSYMKPRVAKGKYKNKYENYSYYDEKEWRYVPQLFNEEAPKFISGYKSQSELDKFNSLIRGKSIDFPPDAVKYIIVNEESDIEMVADGLRNIKRGTKKFNESDVNKLISKIITRKQIREDF